MVLKLNHSYIVFFRTEELFLTSLGFEFPYKIKEHNILEELKNVLKKCGFPKPIIKNYIYLGKAEEKKEDEYFFEFSEDEEE